jgi:steroid 5-alpha reductase family enzyme
MGALCSYDGATGGFLANKGRAASLAFVLLGYVVAIAGAAAGAWALHTSVSESEQGWAFALWLSLVADLVATVVTWLLAVLVNNSSTYDPYWSLFTPLAVAYWAFFSAPARASDVPLARAWLVMVSAAVWSTRLTGNWIRDWGGLMHEDFRYAEIRTKFQSAGLPVAAYWLGGSFGGIMLFPTLLVFLGSVPAYLAVVTGVKNGPNPVARPLNCLDGVACAVSVGAALLQFVADEQMRVFRNSEHAPGACMELGLWRYS